MSIYERFPSLKGVVLQRAARNQYVIETNVSAPFFKDKERTVRTFQRHPLNNRAQADTRAKYKDGVLAQGLVQ
eukprot:6705546-Pyramimonas_sp.AAC.1